MVRTIKRYAWVGGWLAAATAAIAVVFLSAPAPDARAAGTPKPSTHDAAWRTAHGPFARTGRSNCSACHQDDYCAACHYSDNPLERYHRSDYAAFHGVDKFVDERECANCHDTQDSCNVCHEASRAGVMGGGRPADHGLPGWAGGGHAESARAELDACAACHDPLGADPTCMNCHRTGVSPHGDDVVYSMGRGPWHEDKGYVCYRCHGGGDDFCEKCHEDEGEGPEFSRYF